MPSSRQPAQQRDVPLEPYAPAGLLQVLATHAAQRGVVQDQVGQLTPLLHQVDAGQAGDLLREAVDAEDLAEDVPGVVEAQGLVEVACQQVLLHPTQARPR